MSRDSATGFATARLEKPKGRVLPFPTRLFLVGFSVALCVFYTFGVAQ